MPLTVQTIFKIFSANKCRWVTGNAFWSLTCLDGNICGFFSARGNLLCWPLTFSGTKNSWMAAKQVRITAPSKRPLKLPLSRPHVYIYFGSAQCALITRKWGAKLKTVNLLIKSTGAIRFPVCVMSHTGTPTTISSQWNWKVEFSTLWFRPFVAELGGAIAERGAKHHLTWLDQGGVRPNLRREA